MVVEILVHYHCKGVVNLGLSALTTAGITGVGAATILRLATQIATYESLKDFDCGEAENDDKRWMWDSVQGFSGILETLLID